MYGAIPEEFDDVKKVMGEMSSLLTVNGLCNLICERDQESNFKFTIGANHEHTGNYLWDDDETTVKMTSDDNDTIVDKYYNQSEVETDQNHT